MGFGASALACVPVGVAFNLTASEGIPWTEGTVSLLISGVVMMLISGLLHRAGRDHRKAKLSRREAILCVATIWLGAGLLGSLPFILGAGLHPVDGIFESVSGLTTTGATILLDVEALSMPLHLWRSLLQWLGGMGIVVLFVAVFPGVGVGGKHMFKNEAPGATSEGLRPRIAKTASVLWWLYVGFTVLLFVVLLFLEMDTFDAVCHALTTMATGGFSTRNASIGAFSPQIQYAIAVFMLLGTVNFGLYFVALRQQSLRHFGKSTEFRIFIAAVILATIALTIANFALHGADIEIAFRRSFFMVSTTLSSTGYGNHSYAAVGSDYMGYGSFALAIFIVMMIIGGCSGSTAGGMKLERVIIAAKQSWIQITRTFRPTVVRRVRMGRTVISAEIVNDVVAFIVIYFMSVAVGVFVVTAIEGVPVPTAFGAMVTSVSNMGPGPFHDLVTGMSDNFASYSPWTKLFCAFSMIVGRLEFMTLFALVVPDFWRR